MPAQMHVLVADILNALDKIPMLPPDFEPRLKVRRWLEVRQAQAHRRYSILYYNATIIIELLLDFAPRLKARRRLEVRSAHRRFLGNIL